MRIVISVLLILLSTLAFGQYEKFKPVEPAQLADILKVHSSEEGPGTDYYGELRLRIHLSKAAEPIQNTDRDTLEISKLIGPVKTGKFGPGDYKNKFYFEFHSNAPWKREKAIVNYFINDVLLQDYHREIRPEDEVWIFTMIKSYSTFEMNGYGWVVDFMDRN